ncbi:hypothetical protein A8H39_02000 [Paraburkholderia fungorum]|nr:hypothetical protein A8H39_02000 [Paraburkholderia fungorum]
MDMSPALLANALSAFGCVMAAALTRTAGFAVIDIALAIGNVVTLAFVARRIARARCVRTGDTPKGMVR